MLLLVLLEPQAARAIAEKAATNPSLANRLNFIPWFSPFVSFLETFNVMPKFYMKIRLNTSIKI
jgi:hypothetical protein